MKKQSYLIAVVRAPLSVSGRTQPEERQTRCARDATGSHLLRFVNVVVVVFRHYSHRRRVVIVRKTLGASAPGAGQEPRTSVASRHQPVPETASARFGRVADRRLRRIEHDGAKRYLFPLRFL